MKKSLLCLLLFLFANLSFAKGICSKGPFWAQKICQRLGQIWTEGEKELYLSGYSWHNRFMYSPERIKHFNELAWGGGLGKGLYDKKGDWHGLFAFAFLDSHKNVEPVAGYAFLKIAHLSQKIRVGLGYSILVTARPDILNNVPFPGVIPWASIAYKRVALAATYIPGARGAGNVLYIVGKIKFDLF